VEQLCGILSIYVNIIGQSTLQYTGVDHMVYICHFIGMCISSSFMSGMGLYILMFFVSLNRVQLEAFVTHIWEKASVTLVKCYFATV